MEIFRKVLTTMGWPEEKAKGAFIPLDIDYPLHEHIILIGDAGGFANRLTFEGLYYAFLTASHAAEAIDSGRPFAEVSRQVFDNKRKEERLTRLFYSRSGLKLFRFLCKRLPGVVRWSYNKATN
jgi:flavin-dependent dehydrogenase